MNHYFSLSAISAFISVTSVGWGASAGAGLYGDAPDDHHPWAVHDPNRPQPKIVTPGTFSSPDQAGQPPSDAIVLFDGSDLSKWESAGRDPGPAKWVIKEGAVQCNQTGNIRTKDKFGDCQLHVEWAAPKEVKGSGQGRGNSGIFLMGLVEIQVLDSYNNITYADGHAAAVYGVNPPLANALRPPGEFQVYDLVFRRPLYKDGQVLDPGYVTLFVNGVLAQDHTPLEGGTGHRTRSKPRAFPAAGPLVLQDHSNPVRFRNIWYRPLPPRSLENGTDGVLSVEATMAKRKEIAAAIRQDAAQHENAANTLPVMLRLMESLEYETDEATVAKVKEMAERYLEKLKNLPEDQLPAKRNEVVSVNDGFKFLAKFKLLPASFGPKEELEKFVKDRGWDRRPRAGQ